LRLENLGWIVEASKYQANIWEKLDSFGVVKLLGSPSDLSLSEHGVDIGFADRRESFDLLIGADGVNSFVRRALSLPIKKNVDGSIRVGDDNSLGARS
jgi:2-polyprenyl-6-methoxyphenol hydroxylase-like FAD-dependent oxidoreductase